MPINQKYKLIVDFDQSMYLVKLGKPKVQEGKTVPPVIIKKLDLQTLFVS